MATRDIRYVLVLPPAPDGSETTSESYSLWTHLDRLGWNFFAQHATQARSQGLYVVRPEGWSEPRRADDELLAAIRSACADLEIPYGPLPQPRSA